MRLHPASCHRSASCSFQHPMPFFFDHPRSEGELRLKINEKEILKDLFLHKCPVTGPEKGRTYYVRHFWRLSPIRKEYVLVHSFPTFRRSRHSFALSVGVITTGTHVHHPFHTTFLRVASVIHLSFTWTRLFRWWLGTVQSTTPPRGSAIRLHPHLDKGAQCVFEPFHTGYPVVLLVSCTWWERKEVCLIHFLLPCLWTNWWLCVHWLMIFLFIQARIYSALRWATRWRVVNRCRGKFSCFPIRIRSRCVIPSRCVIRWSTDPDVYTRFFFPVGHFITDSLVRPLQPKQFFSFVSSLFLPPIPEHGGKRRNVRTVNANAIFLFQL